MTTFINNTTNKVVAIGIAIGLIYLAAWTGWIDDPKDIRFRLDI